MFLLSIGISYYLSKKKMDNRHTAALKYHDVGHCRNVVHLANVCSQAIGRIDAKQNYNGESLTFDGFQLILKVIINSKHISSLNPKT